MNPRALLIFAKEPKPGCSKTRMSPPWSLSDAAELSLCFIRDTLNAVSKIGDTDCYLFFSPESARPFFQELVPRRVDLIPQQGNDLTERCAYSITEAFARGYTQVVQIGTDTPQIQPEHIEGAFEALQKYDMGFGPTKDGGYYILSLSQPVTGIYEGVIMGRDTVFQEIMANAVRLGLRVKTLAQGVDADTHTDLLYLTRGHGVTLGRHTREFLSSRLHENL